MPLHHISMYLFVCRGYTSHCFMSCAPAMGVDDHGGSIACGWVCRGGGEAVMACVGGPLSSCQSVLGARLEIKFM